MNWLQDTINSNLSPEAKEDSIRQEFKEQYLDDLTRVVDQGYEGGFHNPHLVLTALKQEIDRVRTELDAGV